MSTTASFATTSRSSLGPLTTTYTAPSICSIYGIQPGNGDSWQAQGCDSNGNVVDTSSCWPPALVSAPNPPYQGWGFYSPGLVCPSGYVSACEAAVNPDGSTPSITHGPSFSFQFPLIPGETAIGCCPSSFTCGGGNIQTCFSVMTTGSYLAGICESPVASLTDLQYITIPGTNTVAYASTVIVSSSASASLFAPLFQLNNQPTTTTSLSSSSSAITTSITSPTTTASSTPSSGLSVGATVAIAVVIPVVVLAIAGVLAFWWFRRRKRNRASAVTHPAEGISHSVELQPSDRQPEKVSRRSELDASSRAHELEVAGSGSDHKGYQPVPQELEASGS